MAHTHIVTLTIMIKRVAKAIKKLYKGINAVEYYANYHNIPELLENQSYLPPGFSKSDYADIQQAFDDVQAFVANHQSFGNKFTSFDPNCELDPTDILGKQIAVFVDYDPTLTSEITIKDYVSGGPGWATMSNSEKVGVFTCVVKRVVQGMKNINKSLDHCNLFKQIHNIGSLLSDPNNIPEGFTKDDYLHANQIYQDVDQWVDDHSILGNKFLSYDGIDISDIVGEVGRRFWRDNCELSPVGV